jgi:hypothetical protein
MYMTPTILFSLLVIDLSSFGHVRYEDYVYPTSVQILGYAITGASLVWIPSLIWVQRRQRSNSSADWLLKPTEVMRLD